MLILTTSRTHNTSQPYTTKFSSSFSKVFSRLMRWLMMWVNIFWTSTIISPLSILNISYSWIRVCFLALFTSLVPSWVTSKVSHISFADLHWETLKNSSEFKAEVIMFLAMQSNLAFLLLESVYWDQGFSMEDPSFSNFGTKGPFSLHPKFLCQGIQQIFSFWLSKIGSSNHKTEVVCWLKHPPQRVIYQPYKNSFRITLE